ncbi:hypothetical protein [Vibrio maerlii]|uniref:hypothetical protein n=1 Tax=Vibrio maerlii TaxID=2231648 RepID=UPI000E3BA23E|nr:hypothetical protein [Vibrio maerlii]
MKDINKTDVAYYTETAVIEHDELNMDTVQVDGVYVVERRKRIERRTRNTPVAFERRTSCDRRNNHRIDIEV